MKFTIPALMGAAMLSTAASADIYTWDWSAAADGTAGLNMNGGEFQSIHAEYNNQSQRFLWSVTFADQITDGYTLAVNNGPNPKGHAGELGLIYFDASEGSPIVTVYAYNGVNAQNSYADGSPASGTQAPDMILASDGVANHSSIMQASVVDDMMAGTRTMTLEISASFINNHIPANPGPEGPSEWTGVQFAELLGLWMHPMTNLNTDYDQDMALTQWSGAQGWFDGSNFTTSVPTPGSVALLGLGGLVMGRRRRS